MSDIIILNIEQKIAEIEKTANLLKNKELFPQEKMLILINNYDRKSKYTAKNMGRELGKAKKILTVPYTNLLSEAIQEGNLAEFFLNLKASNLVGTDDRTSYFINELKDVAETIVYKMQEMQIKA